VRRLPLRKAEAEEDAVAVAAVEHIMIAVADGTIITIAKELEVSIIAVAMEEEGAMIATVGVVVGVIAIAVAECAIITRVVAEDAMISAEADVEAFGISNPRRIGVNKPRNRPFWPNRYLSMGRVGWLNEEQNKKNNKWSKKLQWKRKNRKQRKKLNNADRHNFKRSRKL